MSCGELPEAVETFGGAFHVSLPGDSIFKVLASAAGSVMRLS